MAQTKEGALKRSAKNAGMTIEEYQLKVSAGFKRCTRCKTWKLISEFGNDRTRSDGVDATCFSCRRVKERKSTKGRVSTFMGKHHSAEARSKLSAAHKGKPNSRKGIPHSLDTRTKISISVRQVALRGEQCPAYKDGKTEERRGVRFSTLYKRWRFDVFIRDHFTCQLCGDDRGGNLVAHHIKPFAEYPDLRFAVDNGLTLCRQCHKTVHSET